MKNFSIIGAGNVGTRLSLALRECGFTLDFVYDKSMDSIKKLSITHRRSEYFLEAEHSENTIRMAENLDDLLHSDIIFLTISDDSIPELAKDLSAKISENKPLILHTSGTGKLSALSPLKEVGCETGVLYPAMTLSRTKDIDFSIIPFLIEGSSPEAQSKISEIVKSLKAEYSVCSTEERLRFHIAAVFCSNFTNYVLSLGLEIAQKNLDYLTPLTLEMIRKSLLHSPDKVRTGPAVRGDIKTIEKHIQLMEDLGLEEHKEVYELITKNIIKKNVKLQD